MTLEGLKELLEAMRKQDRELAEMEAEHGHYEMANKFQQEAFKLFDVIMLLNSEGHYQKTREIFGLGEDE